MLKSKSLLCLLLALACMAGPVAARGSAASTAFSTTCMAEDSPGLSSQLLKQILELALAEWPTPNNYTYGTFRSAYNHGTLTTWAHDTITDAYWVSFGGVLICVQLPI